MNNLEDLQQDELEVLKERADQIGLKYHPSIGVDKLREKVNEALTSTGPVEDAETTPVLSKANTETAGQIRARKRKEASELVRVRVTCMNPSKREWEGEFFSVGNAVVGTFTKFVPFNIDAGYHIPRIIYKQLKDRKCQIFVTEKDSKGRSVRVGKLIKEFAVDVLPSLTDKELKELAQRQAMAKGTA